MMSKGEKGKSKLSLCWSCERAGRASCEWMQRGVPVKGWNAEPTIVYLNKNHRAHSFRVRECPKSILGQARTPGHNDREGLVR